MEEEEIGDDGAHDDDDFLMPLHKLKVSQQFGVCKNGSTKKQRRHSIKICIRFHHQNILKNNLKFPFNSQWAE